MQFDDLARCRGWIEAALERTDTHTFDDVVFGIYAGHFQFWPLPNAAVVTQIEVFPRKRRLNVFAAGGDLKEIMAHEATLEDFARENGCSSLACQGRRGWHKVEKRQGVRPLHYLMERDI